MRVDVSGCFQTNVLVVPDPHGGHAAFRNSRCFILYYIPKNNKGRCTWEELAECVFSIWNIGRIKRAGPTGKNVCSIEVCLFFVSSRKNRFIFSRSSRFLMHVE